MNDKNVVIARYRTKNWKALVSIQNKYYPDQDILSITAMFDDEKFINHVNRYKNAAMLKILNK